MTLKILGHNARPNLFSRDSSLIGRNVGSGIHARHRKLVDSMKFSHNSPSNSYVIMTQDTNTTYGQMDLTAFEFSGKVDVGAEQRLFSGGNLQTGVDGEKELGGKVKGAKLKVVGMGGRPRSGWRKPDWRDMARLVSRLPSTSCDTNRRWLSGCLQPKLAEKGMKK